jgi:SAM-dependent methyltransferase
MKKIRRWLVEHQAYQLKRYVTLAVVDALDRIRGRADPELPPKRKRDFVGGGDFREVGEEFAGYAAELGELKPSDRVLEIGSGIGRIALPLTRLLDGQGSYDGVEIVPRGVDWCQRHITPKHPRFRFHHADIANRTYNRRGKLDARQYAFPFPADSFDLALLTSVFTHLLPATVEHYVSELARMMAPGGRILATFYLLDDQSRRLLDEGRSAMTFPFQVDGVWVADKYVPENAVAYPEPAVRDLLGRHGFSISTIRHGSWVQRADTTSHQDIVVAKTGAAPRP